MGRNVVGVRNAEICDAFAERKEPNPALHADSCWTGLAIAALDAPFELAGSCDNVLAREKGRRFAILELYSVGRAVRGASSTSAFETSTGGVLARELLPSSDVGVEFVR